MRCLEVQCLYIWCRSSAELVLLATLSDLGRSRDSVVGVVGTGANLGTRCASVEGICRRRYLTQRHRLTLHTTDLPSHPVASIVLVRMIYAAMLQICWAHRRGLIFGQVDETTRVAAMGSIEAYAMQTALVQAWPLGTVRLQSSVDLAIALVIGLSSIHGI